MFYYQIKNSSEPRRTIEGLQRLRQSLRASGIPAKCPNHLLLATWNIREFDSNAYGKRDLEPLYYIAEICSAFDIIAIQEVREDLAALRAVTNILGSTWKYVVTDVTEGKPGNRERMAFVYDSRNVRFSGLAGEIVIPPVERKEEGTETRYIPAKQLYRTPYLVGFRAGWTQLLLCTVHILYGKDVANDPNRTEEIQLLAEFLAKRVRERASDYNNLVLLGDFNIFSPQDNTMKALTIAGFEVPQELQQVPATNTGSRKRHYDQIAIIERPFRVETTGKAGVFDFFEAVYRDEDEMNYRSMMGSSYNTNSKGNKRSKSGKRSYYRTYWRTHQMSDHLPMWIQFRVNFADEYLVDQLKKAKS